MSTDAPVQRRGRFIAVAAAAGILVGTAAVYVTGLDNGNAELLAAECADALAAAARAAPFAKGEVAAFQVAAKGEILDDLMFLDPDGGRTGVQAMAGKMVLLNLWATWCAPCRAEMPTLDRLAATRNGDDFRVVAVDLDVGDAVKRAPAFLEEIGVRNLPFYSDPSGALLNAMKKHGALGLPTTFLIGPKGCRIGIMQGPAEWDSPEALALINAAVGKAKAASTRAPAI